MHQEHMERAFVAAAVGQRVAVFAATRAEARAIFLDMADRLPAGLGPVDVRRLNGGESLTFEDSGGWIRFYSLRNSGGFGGACVDRVFLPVGTSPDLLLEILPAMSRAGVLTGY